MKDPSVSISLRIISHNIRYATESPSDGENPWPDRCPRLLSQLQYHLRFIPNTLICLQEVLHNQLEDIVAGLNRFATNWAYVGVGRDDGEKAGEYAPIIYCKHVFTLEHSKTFWLSESPDRPSKGWDAASVRLVTLAVFQHRESRERVVVMNTHLDDQGSIARRESARLIIEEARSWTSSQRWPSSLPVLLAGDMNSTEDEEAYKILSDKDSPLRDVRAMCEPDAVYGYSNTWTGFDNSGGGEGLKRIDFLFCGHREAEWWTAKGHAVLANEFDDKVFLSDHRAVVGDLVLHQKY